MPEGRIKYPEDCVPKIAFEKLIPLFEALTLANDDIKGVLALILKMTLRLVQAPAGWIAIVDKDKQFLNIEVQKGFDRKNKIEIGKGVSGWVAQHGSHIREGDVKKNLVEGDTYIQCLKDTNSELAAPLKIGELVIGVMNVESPEYHAFCDNHEKVLLMMADCASLVYKRVVSEKALKAFHNVANQINLKAPADELFHIVADECRSLLFARSCSIFFRDRKTERIVLRATTSRTLRKGIGKYSYGKNEPHLTSIVFTKAQVCSVEDMYNPREVAQLFPEFERNPEDQFKWRESELEEVKSRLLAPMKMDGACLGVIRLARSTPFSMGDRELVETYADYLTHYIDMFSEYMEEVNNIKEETENLKKENVKLTSYIKRKDRLGGIIGQSDPMQKIYDDLIKAAGRNESVAIYGETGSGKELVAREIHARSKQKDKDFVVVNCAAIPENLLESFFFGHKKGAFTGAYSDEKGYLDSAHGGTLFLDEVGDLSVILQAKLLRAMEYGEYTPVGGRETRVSDFRLISATNKRPADLVRKKLMREDFYYRINVISIELPPLRHRSRDIRLLADHFMRKYSSPENGSPVLTGDHYESLMNYSWPGNVRHLQNVIRRYISIGRLEFTNVLEYPTASVGYQTFCDDSLQSETSVTLKEQMELHEKQIIESFLKLYNWKIGKTAEALGINRTTLNAKMKQFNLKKPF